MPVHFVQPKKRWEFTFNRVIAGRRQRATKLLPEGWTRTQAQAYDQEESARLLAIASGQQVLNRRRTIDEAVEVYCREVLPGLKNKVGQLAEFNNMHWAYKGRFIDELPDVAREFTAEALNAKTGEPLSDQSIKNRLSYLRAACRYAFKYHKFCEHNPSERMILPSPRNERHYYPDRKQVLQIARKVSSKNPLIKSQKKSKLSHWDTRAVILAAFYSGMRLAEILRCTIEGTDFLLTDTKNGERRLTPIHPKLTQYLHRFPLATGRRTLQTNFRQACDALGWKHLHGHDLRHGFASELLNAGFELEDIGGVLGHKSTVSTKRYAHLDMRRKREVIDAVGRKRG